MKKRFFTFTVAIITIIILAAMAYRIGYYSVSIKNKEIKSNGNIYKNSKALIFGQTDDYKIADLQLGIDLIQVKNILGNPKSEMLESENVVHGNIMVLTYPMATLSFIENVQQKGTYDLFEITVINPNTNGPRNIKVGDNVDSVLKKFPHGKVSTDKGERNLYMEGNKYGKIYCENDGIISFLGFFDGENCELKINIKNDKVSEIKLYEDII